MESPIAGTFIDILSMAGGDLTNAENVRSCRCSGTQRAALDPAIALLDAADMARETNLVDIDIGNCVL